MNEIGNKFVSCKQFLFYVEVKNVGGKNDLMIKKVVMIGWKKGWEFLVD